MRAFFIGGTNMEEVENLKAAPLSPRMDNGVIKWFDGDTFTIQMLLSLVGKGLDENGHPIDDAPISLKPTDQVVVTFYDCHKKIVHIFVSTNIPCKPNEPGYNTINLVFDTDISYKFPRGKYTYCVKIVRKKEDGTVDEADITTLCAHNRVEVEPCH